MADIYIDPQTGTLTTSPQPGATIIHGIVPSVTGPIILQCALHGNYHEAGVITIPSSGSGLNALEDFVRTTLAAVSPTCADWRRHWHAFSTTFSRLRADTYGSILTRPVVGSRAGAVLESRTEVFQSCPSLKMACGPRPLTEQV